MKENCQLNDLFNINTRYAFLVGAGISKNYPSNIPLANEIKKNLFSLLVYKEEMSKIQSLSNFRFELVIEQIKSFFDSHLDLFNYFNFIQNPNLIHYFLSKMIIGGHYVITTNFDYLIEIALKEMLNISEKNKIKPIITKKDFDGFNKTFNSNLEEIYPIIKIHGSKRNIISNENTSSSLITTLNRIGDIYSIRNSLGIEPFKLNCLKNTFKNRVLVVMGYSGSDDFDIIPTLKELSEIKEIIWIQHSDSNNVEIIPFANKKEKFAHFSFLSENINEFMKILHYNKKEITIIRANTHNLVTKLIKQLFTLDARLFENKYVKLNHNEIDFYKWASNLYQNITLTKKIRFTCSLYEIANKNKDLLNMAKKGVILCKETENLTYLAQFFHLCGSSNFNLGKIEEALENCKEGLEIAQKIQDTTLIMLLQSDFGLIYSKTGKLKESFSLYNKILQFDIKKNDLNGMFSDYMKICELLEIWGKNKKQFDFLEKANIIAKELGDLEKISNVTNSLAGYYKDRAKYKQALKLYNESMQIADLLKNDFYKIVSLNNISTLFLELYDIENAEININRALKISEGYNFIQIKSMIFNTKSIILLRKGKHKEAKQMIRDAIDNDDFIDDRIAKVVHLNNLSYIYQNEGNLPESLKILGEAYNISKSTGFKEGVFNSLNAIAIIHHHMGDSNGSLQKMEEALKYIKTIDKPFEYLNKTHNYANMLIQSNNFDRAITILDELFALSEKLDIASVKVGIYMSYGKIFLMQNEFNKSFEFFEKSIKISDEIFDITSKIDILLTIAEIYINYNHKDQGKELISIVDKYLDSFPNLFYEAKSKRLLGKYYELNQKFLYALKLYQDGLNILEKNRFYSDIPIFYNHLGVVCCLRKNFDEALSYFWKNLALSSQINDKKKIAGVYYNIGVCYLNKKEDNSARINFLKARKIYQLTGNISKIELIDRILKKSKNLRQKVSTAKF